MDDCGKSLKLLSERGVLFPQGTSGIFVDKDVDHHRIEEGARLYPGCRITGPKTMIRKGARVGLTGPCVLDDMVLGREASLGSGYFEKSVLLSGVKLGSSIRVRENCLLEEGVELSFSVDVKHTFLLADVVLGSEINFCDLLMAGGTSRKDHSEVGSGVIHFNFTPYGKSGDKVTASLVGDVVHGVFYRSKRIFIGGHSSLVGPLRIGYGSVVGAGSRVTSDVDENVLTLRGGESSMEIRNFDFLQYRSISRKVAVSVEYVAQLAALWHWYADARAPFASHLLEKEIIEAAKEVIARGVAARVDRMDRLCEYMDASVERNRARGEEALAAQQDAFRRLWPSFRTKLLDFNKTRGDGKARDGLFEKISESSGGGCDDFVGLVREGLDEGAVGLGVRWLQSIVDALKGEASLLAPPVSRK